MINIKNLLSKHCGHCHKENAELKKVLIEAHDEYSYQYRQHEHEISLMIANLSLYRRWLDARARLEALSVKYRLKSQNAKMLEQAGRQESNTNLRARSSVKGEENEH